MARTGDVTFRLVTLSPDQSRRNSLASNVSGISQMSYSQVASFEATEDVRMRIRSELRAGIEHSCDEKSKSALDSSVSTSSETSIADSASVSQSEKKLSDDELLAHFQKYCTKCPSLLDKIVNWGISQTPNRVGEKEVSELAKGRVWVRASLLHRGKREIENSRDILNELTGAYQEGEQGIFMQPPSQPNEPGTQHRLRKSQNGFRVIEELNVEKDAWCSCAQELPSGHWIDSNDRWKKYKIQLVPMLSILNRMRGQWADVGEMEKSIDFLFNSCNPKKLNIKLKARNLKHNISNLKMRLEKQYALSFAVRVSELADCIAMEG